MKAAGIPKAANNQDTQSLQFTVLFESQLKIYVLCDNIRQQYSDMNYRIRETFRHVPGMFCETLRQEGKAVLARSVPVFHGQDRRLQAKLKFASQMDNQVLRFSPISRRFMISQSVFITLCRAKQSDLHEQVLIVLTLCFGSIVLSSFSYQGSHRGMHVTYMLSVFRLLSLRQYTAHC